MDVWEYIKVGAWFLGGAIAAVLAPIQTALTVLVVLMLLDLVSAIIANGKRKNIDPNAGYLGWKRKTNTVLLVLAAAVLQHVAVPEGMQLPAAEALAGGFALVEFLSVMRNLTLVGGYVPRFLEGLFRKIEDEVLKPVPETPRG